MSDQSLNGNTSNAKNESQLVTLKMDPPVVPGLNIHSNNGSLNIVTKKTSNSGNSIFVVPSGLNTQTHLNNNNNNDTPSSNNTQNKVTLVPLNSTSNDSSKLPNSLTTFTNSKNYIASPISKKIVLNATNIQSVNNTSSNSNNSSSGTVNLISKPSVLNNSNTKIFTISTQNNITSSPNIVPSSNSASSLNSPNKIQYVKIVNTANNGQQNTSVSNQSPIQSGTKPIKITTISANTNTNAIITTTTNTDNSTQEENVATRSQENSKELFPSNMENASLPNQKPPQIEKGNSESSALFDAITNNGQKPGSTTSNSSSTNANTVKLHTFQLLNTNNQNQAKPFMAQQLTPSKTPVIQRIQSVSLSGNQPITKTIVNSGSTTSNQALSPINSYKILSQQVPLSQQSTQLKTINSLNIKTTTNPSTSQVSNHFSINKTIGQNSSESSKQIITTVRNDSNFNTASLKQKNSTISSISSVNSNNNNNNGATILPISQVSNTNSFNILPIKTASPLTVLTSSQNSNNQQIVESIDSSRVMNSPISSSVQTFSPNQSHRSNNSNINLNTSPSTQTGNGSTNNNRKPCNCTKSMCLKLYCDCFAMGSFCHDCNCVNCFNTLEHEDERNKAIKMVLDRNPQAFQSKIGKYTAQITLAKNTMPTPSKNEESANSNTCTEEIDEVQSRHIKGCNCKKSNCLKRYCECYLAKIQCSSLCKCINCKNCDDSTKTLLQLSNAADLRKQQHQQNKIGSQLQQENAAQIISKSSIQLNNLANNFGVNNNMKSAFGSIWHKNKSALNTDEGTSSRNLFLNEDINLNKSKMEQINLEKHQQLSRSYSSLINKSTEMTCSRLIETVSNELYRLKNQKDENDISDPVDSLNDEDEDDEYYSENIENLIIEEFGRCLVNIIQVAEKRN